jgi:hypothetical protein
MGKLKEKIVSFDHDNFKNYCIIPIDKLVPADWNYKQDDQEKSEKLKNNIKRNGQIENIIVRELDTGFFEVVNGNHRYMVMKTLEIENVLCYNLGQISLNQAKRIAIETNEMKFSSDQVKLAEIFNELLNEFSKEDLIETMPFRKDEIDDFNKLLNFDWDQYDSGNAGDEDDNLDDQNDIEKKEIVCPHCGEKFVIDE